MITKGIVVETIDTYKVKVRLPIFDKAEGAKDATANQYLKEAIVCRTPNSNYIFSEGDIVLVGFEDNDTGKPIILGFLYKETADKSSLLLNSGSLNVAAKAKLPWNTQIGNLSARDIQDLSNLKGNLDIKSNLNANNLSTENVGNWQDKLALGSTTVDTSNAQRVMYIAISSTQKIAVVCGYVDIPCNGSKTYPITLPVSYIDTLYSLQVSSNWTGNWERQGNTVGAINSVKEIWVGFGDDSGGTRRVYYQTIGVVNA